MRLFISTFFPTVAFLSLAACSNDGAPPVVVGFEPNSSNGGASPENRPSDEGPTDGTGGAAVDPSPGTGGVENLSGVDSGFGADIVGGGTESGYHVFEIALGGDEYFVQTNPWGGATQTIQAGMGKIFEVVSMVGPGGTEPWQVVSFPSVYKGGAQGGHITEGSGMPIVASEIQSLRTGLKTNASGVTYKGNTTYDVYFTNGPDYDGGAPDDFLMVWFHSNAINPINGEGEGWSCSGQAPHFIEACSSSGSVTIGGQTFFRFRGYNSDHRVISYVPETTFDEWEYDLKDFIDDAVAEGALEASQYLQGVQAGFELIEGGAGLAVEDFYVEVR